MGRRKLVSTKKEKKLKKTKKIIIKKKAKVVKPRKLKKEKKEKKVAKVRKTRTPKVKIPKIKAPKKVKTPKVPPPRKLEPKDFKGVNNRYTEEPKVVLNYIDNKILEIELDALSKTGVISDELGLMFVTIANNLINKRCFINYTYRDDMMGKGIEFLCRYAKNFDINNPRANGFAYISQICYNGFVQYIKEEKKHSLIKDGLVKKSMEHSEMEKFLHTNSNSHNDYSTLDAHDDNGNH